MAAVKTILKETYTHTLGDYNIHIGTREMLKNEYKISSQN